MFYRFSLVLGWCGLIFLSSSGQAMEPFSVEIKGAGRPMILIPGLSCSGHVWDQTVEHFKDRYECHTLTLAGFGGQAKIEAPLLEKVRAGLIQYMADRHLDHPIIIGHSLGGMMAFWVAATAPEQVGPVIALDGVPFFPALGDRAATADSAKPQAEGLRDVLKAQSKEQYLFGLRFILATQITDPANLEKVAAECGKSDPKAVAQAVYELMTTDPRPRLADIRAPVLLIGATGAIEEPAAKKVMEESYRLEIASIPRHQLVFAPKARHFVQLDEPEFFYEQVESFLKQNSP